MAEKKADILESLKEQLRKKQADISVFKDLLDDYMTLYDVKKKLKTDIKKRGVTFETTSASGKATIVKQRHIHRQRTADEIYRDRKIFPV